MKKHQILVVHIIDQQESSPSASGDITLRDVEGGHERKIFLDPELVRRYQQELHRYLGQIEAICASRQIDYLRTTTQIPFEDFVLKTLRQASSVN